MRTRNLVFGLILLILAFSACREITVTTVVNHDGSFTRIITITGDSSDVFKTDLPYPVDSSWVMKTGRDSADTAKLMVSYSKDYKDCEELNNEIRKDTGWMRQLNRSLDIGKRFGFFYSHVRYREVYPAANPYRLLSYKDHVSQEDYLWATRQQTGQSPADSLKRKNAEEKVLMYLTESAAAEIEKILSDGIIKLNDPRLSAKEVTHFHDSIIMALTKWEFKDPGDIIGYYSQWTNNPAILRLNEIQPPLFSDFNRRGRFLEQVLMMEEFRVEAALPGLITSTNSTQLKGSRVSWDVFPMAFLLEDYVISAESRVINLWAFVLSGIILLSAVVLLVFKSLKK